MNLSCNEARRMLDRGVIPGATPPRNPVLGFHLSQCAACRAYRTRPSWQRRLPRLFLVAVAVLFAGAMLLSGASAWRTWGNLQMISSLPPSGGGGQPSQSPQPRSEGAGAQLAQLAPLVTLSPTAALPRPTLRPAPPTPPPPVPPAPPAAINLLLLGLDARPNEQGIPRSDALMIARIDPHNRRVALLSFPRDLWVPIPGYGAGRINAAYVWGEFYAAPGGGPGLAQATVEAFTGLPIDAVVVIDFANFHALIDAIGGVELDVPVALRDAAFPTMNYGYQQVAFAAGPQTLNGEQALIYARIRHPDSDFARTTRQQALLVAVARRLQARGAFANLQASEAISHSLAAFVRTDLPSERIVALAWSMRHFDPAQIVQIGFTEADVQFGVGADRFALSSSSQILASKVAALLGAPAE